MRRTPILLVGFNRPALTARVLERIVAAAPEHLLLASDGPRAQHPSDAARCAEVRQLFDAVRIAGTVSRDDAPANLGCGVRIATAITWALRQHDAVIVLEDDLLPEPSFFRFCDELLERYRDDARIGMVSGGNYQFGRVRGPDSYYFSRGVGTWGWATWRRAWEHFDFELRRWPAARQAGMLADVWERPEVASYWTAKLDEVAGGRADVWDYQWAFALWSHGLLQVVPNRNLISCIGFTPDATHLTDPASRLAAMPTEALAFPLSHPTSVEPDGVADLWEFHNVFAPLPVDALEADPGPARGGREADPLLSICICTFDRAPLLDRALAALTAQEADAVEILVVDNNSGDDTRAVFARHAARDPRLRYCQEPQQGLSHARNRGWREARGVYVGYLDDDAVPDPDWLEVADRVARDVAPEAFGGPFFAHFDDGRKPPWFRLDYESHDHGPEPRALGGSEFLCGSNLFVRRRVLAALHGFDPALGMKAKAPFYGEETDLLLRLRAARPDATVLYEPRLRIRHRVRDEKTRFGWLARAAFADGRASYRVFTESRHAAWAPRAARALLGVVADLPWRTLARDRSSFPHPQNYLYERTLQHVRALGGAFEHLKVVAAEWVRSR